MRRSIRTKLLLAVGFFYILSIACVLPFIIVTTKSIITSEKEDAYAEQLNVLLRRLQKRHDKLVNSDMEGLFAQGYKNSIAKDLGELHYTNDRTIYPFIVDESGIVVLHPVLEPGSAKLTSLEFIKRMLALKNGTLNYQWRGDDKWMIFRTFEPWGWTIGYAIKQQDKYASIREVVNSIAAIMIVSSVLVICIMYFMLSRMVGPLRVLAEDAKIIGQGNHRHDVSRIRGQDELADLAKAFRSMASSVREREKEICQLNENLEQRVEDRTAKLKMANESLLQIKHAVESSTDAVGMSTPGGIHFYQNDAFRKMFGYETAEELAAAGGGPKTYSIRSMAENVFGAVKAGGSWTDEVEMVHKNGTELTVLLRADAIKDESGRIIGLVCIHTDISNRKRTEKELKKAKEAAEAATEAKSMFLANMSHEIRTPLNGVIGMTGLLLDTELNPEQRKIAETVRISGDSLLVVINDILDFSKIEAGKLDLEILDFDLRRTLEDVADVLAMGSFTKGLELVCQIDDKVPALIKGDPGRLRQIVTNLANNAIKFTESGEVVIRASLDAENDDRVTIRFSVTDTGIGIPPDRMELLFQSFSQIDSSTTRKYGGTGLGLVISKKLCEMMGGQIGVTSVESKGSTFWFTAVLEKQPIGRKFETIASENLRGIRILIVDDNATNRRVLEEQLRSKDCYLDEAASGSVALDKLRQAADEGAPFDVAILDMQMPFMDGETLGRQIKQDPKIKETLLVMLTSLGLTDDAMQMREIGFAAYLSKPIKSLQLYECLSKVTETNTEAGRCGTEPIVTRHSISEGRKHNVRILLAEDNMVNQKVAMSLLQKLGYRVDAVANGQEALKALEMISYDIVLMDVQMPEMDGFEATSAIRSSKSCVHDHDVPIIAMTAHAMKGDRERCLEAGMDDYTSKPIDPKDLQNKIEKWICIKKDIPSGCR